MCIYNQMIKNRKYVKNKTNNGNIPYLPDRRIEYIPAGCGKCIECRKKIARDWQIRLLEDIKTHTNGKFIAFTFSDESIANLLMEKISKTNKNTGELQKITIADLKGYDKDNSIATRSIHLWRENWRKEFKQSPRHWLITELGHKGTENIHLHGIIWTNESYTTIRRKWPNGFIWPRPHEERKAYVSSRTINYVIKYITKVDQRNKEYKPKILCSSGIGADYINSINARQNFFNGKDTIETYTTSTGHKISLPIYYRNKLYTEEERERLWLHKLDKEERWVLGKKIDISKDEEEYKRAVQYARQLNKELGYGQRPNENRKEYEEQRRELMIMTRINRSKNSTPSAGSIQKGTD